MTITYNEFITPYTSPYITVVSNLFGNMALLKVDMHLNPKPHSFLCVSKLSQDLFDLTSI